MTTGAEDTERRAQHVRFWDEWNTTWRVRDSLDPFMGRQAAIAREVASTQLKADAKVLDVGCGTGWLANELVGYGEVVATDLSPEAIAAGTKLHPGVKLVCGDFMDLELSGPFDLVLSSDSLVPMPDHAACLARIADLQRAGGVLLLMTQNPFVWSRRSRLRAHDPSVPNGSVDQWPDRRTVKRLLNRHYEIVSFRTICPGGDRGVLFWVENRYVRGIMARLSGSVWSRVLERVGLGQEFVVVARRRERT